MIGIDEVGRGPLAGPMTLCSCRMANHVAIEEIFGEAGIKDSKKLNMHSRLALLKHIKPLVKAGVIEFRYVHVPAGVIDSAGISIALKKSIERLLAPYGDFEEFVYLDGSLPKPARFDSEVLIKGDERNVAIALASVRAKELRDSLMRRYHKLYPQYGFDTHVGYGTKKHREAIKMSGLTPIHRKSFCTRLV